MFVKTQPCFGIIGAHIEERGPNFHLWAAGGMLMRALEAHTRCGIQWWMANPRYFQTDFNVKLHKVQPEQKV